MTKFDLVEVLLEIPDNPEIVCLGVGDNEELAYVPVGGLNRCADGQYMIHGEGDE